VKDLVDFIGQPSSSPLLLPSSSEPSSSPPLLRSSPECLPNPALTPGSVVILDFAAIDLPGYALQWRDVTQKAKEKVYRRYGIAPRERRRFDIDHLVPLSLGGSNDLRNLWPHPWDCPWNPRMKAALEARLRVLVRQGVVGLREAQEALCRDWVEAYGRYLI
jgi:hypothetical protein